MGVGVLRNGEHGLDYSLLIKYHKLDEVYKLKDFEPEPSPGKLSADSGIQRRLTSPGPVSPMKNVLNTAGTSDKGAAGKRPMYATLVRL